MKKITTFEDIKKIIGKKVRLTKTGIAALSLAGVTLLTTACGSKNTKTQAATNTDKAAVVEVEITPLTKDNFETESAELLKSLSEKGLDVRPELIDSTLRVVNQSHFVKADYDAIFGKDYDVVKDVENSLNLRSMIRTHNFKSDVEHQISYAQFSYDTFDYAILNKLDDFNMNLVKATRNVDENTDQTVNDVIVAAEPFFVRGATIKVGDKDYAKLNLTPGAQLWSEAIGLNIIDETNLYDNDAISKNVELLVQSDKGMDKCTKELHLLRTNLGSVLESQDRLKAYYATFKEGSENKELTKEQQEKLGLIKLSLGREILIQNIQNECQGVASLPHIMNFDSTCVEAEKDTTK